MSVDDDSARSRDTAPQRQLVQRSADAQRPLRPTRELAEGTPVGDAYLASLIRTQRLLALRLLMVVALVLVGVPVAFFVEPRLRHVQLFDVPLAWIVLVGGYYPLFMTVAVAYVRRADRNEHDFVEMVTGDTNAGGVSSP